MDLNSAMHTARCGGKVRDDAVMRADWGVAFFPVTTKENMKRPPAEREGLFYYVNPLGEKAHKIIFSDAMRSSFQWRTML